MTTIAYKDGVLAADTLTTTGNHRDSLNTKIERLPGGVLVAASGTTPLCIRFRNWVRGGMKGDCPLSVDDSTNGLVVSPDGWIVNWCKEGPWPVGRGPYAGGSGYEYAMGAMAAGADAETAVRIAMKYDVRTGGAITVLRSDNARAKPSLGDRINSTFDEINSWMAA